MSATNDGHITDQNIAAEFERDGLVAQADRFKNIRIGLLPLIRTNHTIQDAIVTFQTAAIDHAIARDENIGEVLAPDEAVVKKTVPAILIRIVRPRLGFIIGIQILWRAENNCARINVQMDIALEPDGAA